jgi:hypothetical protein
MLHNLIIPRSIYNYPVYHDKSRKKRLATPKLDFLTKNSSFAP